MSTKKIITNITWLVGAVSTYRGRLSLGYCCKGQGVFMIIPTGKKAGLYNFYPFLVTEAFEENGECEFARICLVPSCPLNKATYESIATKYKLTVEEAKRLIDRAKLFIEGLFEIDPELKSRLCKADYALMYKEAPIRVRPLKRNNSRKTHK